MTKPGYKTCPICAEEIREAAKVCRFCGAVLTDEKLGAMLPRRLARVVDEALEEARSGAGDTVKREADAVRGAALVVHGRVGGVHEGEQAVDVVADARADEHLVGAVLMPDDGKESDPGEKPYCYSLSRS